MSRPAPEIVTFYSHKGGVGRSQAVANVGTALAHRGRDVLLVDMDLEAPGLHRFFHAAGTRERLADGDLGPGVLDWFLAASRLPETEPPFPAPVAIHHAGRGRLRLLSVGRLDTAYAGRLAELSWSALYSGGHGYAIVERFREQLLGMGADVVLIDARTGLTDVSSVATFQLPDRAVLMFTLHHQGIEGTARMAHALRKGRDARWNDGRLRDIYLLASRVHQAESGDLRRDWETRARVELDALGTLWIGPGAAIPHDGDAAFGENVVVSALGVSGGLAEAYEALTDRLFADVTRIAPGAQPDRVAQIEHARILAEGLREAVEEVRRLVKRGNDAPLAELGLATRRASPSFLGPGVRHVEQLLAAPDELTPSPLSATPQPRSIGEWVRLAESLVPRVEEAWEAWLDRPPEELLEEGYLDRRHLRERIPNRQARSLWIEQQLQSELEKLRPSVLMRILGLIDPADGYPTSPTAWKTYELLEGEWKSEEERRALSQCLWVAEWSSRLRDGFPSGASVNLWEGLLQDRDLLGAVFAGIDIEAVNEARSATAVWDSLITDHNSREFLARYFLTAGPPAPPADRLRNLSLVLHRDFQGMTQEILEGLLELATAADDPQTGSALWAALVGLGTTVPPFPPAYLVAPLAQSQLDASTETYLLHRDLLRTIWNAPEGRLVLVDGLTGGRPATARCIDSLAAAGLPPPGSELAAAWGAFSSRLGSRGREYIQSLKTWFREWTRREDAIGETTPARVTFQPHWAPAVFYADRFQETFADHADKALRWNGPVEVEADRLRKLDGEDWLAKMDHKRDESRLGGNAPHPDVRAKILEAFKSNVDALLRLAHLRAGGDPAHDEALRLARRLWAAAAPEEQVDVGGAEWISQITPGPAKGPPGLIRVDNLLTFASDLLNTWAGRRTVDAAFEERLALGDPACARLVLGDPEREHRARDWWARELQPRLERHLVLQAHYSGLLLPADAAESGEAQGQLSRFHDLLERARVASLERIGQDGRQLLKELEEAELMADLALSEAERAHQVRTLQARAEILAIKREADGAVDEAMFTADGRRLDHARRIHTRLVDRVRAFDADGAREQLALIRKVLAGEEVPDDVVESPAPPPSLLPARPPPVRPPIPDLGQFALAAMNDEAKGESNERPDIPIWGVWARSELHRFRDALAGSALREAGHARVEWLVAAGRVALLEADSERAGTFWREAIALGLALEISGEHLDLLAHGLMLAALMPLLPEATGILNQRALERLAPMHQRARVAERVDQLDGWGVMADAAVLGGAAVAVYVLDRWLDPAFPDYPAARESVALRAVQCLPIAEAGALALLRRLFPTLRPPPERLASGPARFPLLVEALRTGLRAIGEDPAAEIAADALPQPGTTPTTPESVSLALLTSEPPARTDGRIFLRINVLDRAAPLLGIQAEITLEIKGIAVSRAFHRPRVLPQVTSDGSAEIPVYLDQPPAVGTEGGIRVRLDRRLPDGRSVSLSTASSNFKIRFTGGAHHEAPNPFPAGRPIKEGNCWGRTEALNRVLDRLLGRHDHNVVLVTGERRMGKTSLLHAVANAPRVKATFAQVVWIDLQGIADSESPFTFWRRRLVDPMRAALTSAGLPLPEMNDEAFREVPGRKAADYFAAVDRLLRTQDSRPILVIIDELERFLSVTERKGGLGEDDLAHLREILQGSRHISFVMAGVADVLSRHTRTAAHRLYGLALEENIGALPEDAARELIEEPVRGVYTLIPAARDLLLAETGRHPYLLQFVLHRLYDRAAKRGLRTVTRTDLDELIREEVVSQPIAFANYLAALPGPQFLPILQAVAAVQRGTRPVLAREVALQLDRWGRPHREAEARQLLDELARRAPTVLQRTGNGRFSIPFGLFGRYLREQRRSASSLAID